MAHQILHQINMEKISREDVVTLYRGWKRAENLLMDKTQEIAALSKRIQALETINAKYRGQIEVLGGVKDLSENVNSRIHEVEIENNQLKNDMKEALNKHIAFIHEKDNIIAQKELEKENIITQKELEKENIIMQKELEKENIIIERDNIIMEKEGIIADRDNIIADRDSTIAELHSFINQLNARHEHETKELLQQLGIANDNITKLSHQNKELSEIHNQTELVLQDQLSNTLLLQSKLTMHSHHEATEHNSQIDLAILRGRYDELYKVREKERSEFEHLYSNEQTIRISLEQQLRSARDELASLINTNNELNVSLNTTTVQNNQYDKELMYASEQLAKLSIEVNEMRSRIERAVATEAENNVLKCDIKRLIQLLTHYPAAKGFIESWKNNQDGMTFIGYDDESDLDQMIKDVPMSYADFKHLQRNHGDAVPSLGSSHNMTNESYSWLPRSVATECLAYFMINAPGIPRSILLQFLYKINKLFIEREKIKFKNIWSKFEAENKELKRKLSQLVPAKVVLAETRVKKLQKDIKHERMRRFHCANSSGLNSSTRDLELSQEEFNQVLLDEVVHDHSEHGRLCQQINHLRNATHFVHHNNQSASDIIGSTLQQTFDEYDENMVNKFNVYGKVTQPTVDFLSGALWLSKNICVLLQEALENVEFNRSKYFGDLSNVNSAINTSINTSLGSIADTVDTTSKILRYNLVATSTINESVSICNKMLSKVRGYVDKVSLLRAGDKIAFYEFMNTLPIKNI